jgi:IS30 family transposase
VAEKLRTDIYFANPYSPWERDLNENFNALLRQYIKKGTALRTVTEENIQRIEKSLNLRPRKCLRYKQPAEVFK